MYIPFPDGKRQKFFSLSNADLSASLLSRVSLSDANISNSNLVAADLSEADLSHADLTNSDLSYANLAESDLTSANLSNSNLTNADLTGALLQWANLTGATLSPIPLPTPQSLLNALYCQSHRPSYEQADWQRCLASAAGQTIDNPSAGVAVIKLVLPQFDIQTLYAAEPETALSELNRVIKLYFSFNYSDFH